MPSQWEEPFGRIAVEATGKGIPTLVSLTGGLKKIAGRSVLRVSDFRNADAWANQLRRLLDSDAEYSRNSTAGSKLATRFLGRDSSHKLHELIQSTIKTRPKSRMEKPGSQKQTIALIGSTSRKTVFALINAQFKPFFGVKITILSLTAASQKKWT